MYGFRKEKRGMSKKTRDILIIALAVSIVLNITLTVVLLASSTSDTTLSDTLVSYAKENVSQVRTTATQLSRTGSSYTTQLLGDTRQYLYALQTLNGLASILLGGEILPADVVEAAMEAASQCEARTLAGQAMDEPLAALWTQINLLESQISVPVQ